MRYAFLKAGASDIKPAATCLTGTKKDILLKRTHKRFMASVSVVNALASKLRRHGVTFCPKGKTGVTRFIVARPTGFEPAAFRVGV